jgi:toxin ParE1/3/4
MAEPIWSAAACRDLDDIFDYVAEHNLSAADRLVDMIFERCRLLVDFPEMGQRRSDLTPGLRAFSIRKYVVFFRSNQGIVEVVRVVHGARDLDAIEF